MKRAIGVAALALGLSLLAPARTTALGRFDIKPISITLAPGESAATVEITNDGLALQELEIAPRSWAQSDGNGDGESTDDIVVSPSIFIIAPGKTQVVRLGATHPLEGDLERTYRLVATEIPLAGNGANVQTLLRMRLPIFVPPQTVVATPLSWTVARADDGHLTVRVRNDGNVHARIRALRVEVAGRALFDSVVAAYVLGHQSREWTIALAGDGRAQPIRVVATEMDGSTHEAAFAVR